MPVTQQPLAVERELNSIKTLEATRLPAISSKFFFSFFLEKNVEALSEPLLFQAVVGDCRLIWTTWGYLKCDRQQPLHMRHTDGNVSLCIMRRFVDRAC